MNVDKDAMKTVLYTASTASVCFVQASGAGKSTILKLCARLADPQDLAFGSLAVHCIYKKI